MKSNQTSTRKIKFKFLKKPVKKDNIFPEHNLYIYLKYIYLIPYKLFYIIYSNLKNITFVR